MNFNSGAKSVMLFVLSIVILLLLTLFESALAGLSNATERLLSLFLLVLPSVLGMVSGFVGIVRKETRVWIAYLGVLLNALFAFFHLFVILFAG